MRRFWYIAGGLSFLVLLMAFEWWVIGRSPWTGAAAFTLGVTAVVLFLKSYVVKDD